MSEPADGGRVLDVDETIGTDAESADERTRMSFLDHLDELRKRILNSLYVLVVCCAVTLYFWEPMFVYLAKYFQAQGGQLIFSRPMGAFLFSMKIGVLSGLLVASPFVFSQVWLFVAPGLYAREKKMIVPFVLFSTILFGSGAAFGHFVAFPAMWQFFASYDGLGGIKFLQNIDDTFTLYWSVLLGLGLIFQMPLLVFFLARFGMVSAGFLVKHIKYAVLIIFVLAAVITPSGDVVTLAIFAAPMLGLYVVSIAVAWMFGKKREREA